MTKAELIAAWQEATEHYITNAQAKEYLDRLCCIMTAELLGGGEVPLPGIGKLKVKLVAARAGRNPKTGEAIDIPAGTKVTLKVGKEMREALKA